MYVTNNVDWIDDVDGRSSRPLGSIRIVGVVEHRRYRYADGMRVDGSNNYPTPLPRNTIGQLPLISATGDGHHRHARRQRFGEHPVTTTAHHHIG